LEWLRGRLIAVLLSCWGNIQQILIAGLSQTITSNENLTFIIRGQSLSSNYKRTDIISRVHRVNICIIGHAISCDGIGVSCVYYLTEIAFTCVVTCEHVIRTLRNTLIWSSYQIVPRLAWCTIGWGDWTA